MSKDTFLPVERVRQLNEAMFPLKVSFQHITAGDYYKAGNDPITGTEIYILPASDDVLKNCRTDKKIYRAQPVGRNVGALLTQYTKDVCRNQPTVDVGGVKVLQSSLMDVLVILAIEWGLFEWYTFPGRPGMRLVCANADSKFIIDYRPQKPSLVAGSLVGRI